MPEKPCAHCGEIIVDNPSDPQDEGTREHAVAQQFYFKALRPEIRGQLWTVPAHRRCNEAVKPDEEYFFHFFYPLVGVQNQPMGQAMLAELRRRSSHEQTRGFIRKMLSEFRRETPGGILLPPEVVRLPYDIIRLQNVVVKTAKCLFYKDHNRFMPRSSCIHFEMCQDPEEVQELFGLLRHTRRQTVLPSVFQYWHASFDDMHLFSMLFWESFMYCLAFRDRAAVNQDAVCMQTGHP